MLLYKQCCLWRTCACVWKPMGVNASHRIFQSRALGQLKALGLHTNSMLYSITIKLVILEVEGQSYNRNNLEAGMAAHPQPDTKGMWKEMKSM